MKVEKTKIEGVLLIHPEVYNDERGYFFESFNLKEFREKTGLSDIEFVQDNESFSDPYVLRGLHFQKGEYAQAKLVRVVEGCVIDVVVDMREDSPTYGEYETFKLNGKFKTQVFIPRGCAHGFLVIDEDGRGDCAVFQYKCDNYYNKDAEGGILWNDPAIGIPWDKFENSKYFCISEKDKSYPLIEDWYHRLIIEKHQLKKRVDSLKEFLDDEKFKTLTPDTQEDLKEQLVHMTKYYDVLQRRIEKKNRRE